MYTGRMVFAQLMDLIPRRDPVPSGRQRVPRNRRAVGWGGPEAQVSQDLFNHLRLFDERENPHGSATGGADQRVHLVDLLDQPRPGALHGGGGHAPEFLGGDEFSPCAFRRFPRLALLYQP